ncbi:MAG: leucine-rich repeat protein [Alistipes sp.]|nr:leucine-rich repeat protein [Alistipes sp.]
MKKTLLWGAIASLFFVSCSKSEMAVEPIEPSEDFVAQLTDVSRTELNGTSVIWNAEDELTIFTKTMHNRHYKVKTLSEDGRTATFGFVNYTGTSNGTISANYAVYPYDAQATLNGDVISTVIASEQQYNAEKVDLSYALMAAKSESNSFAFVNAGALMRFNVSKSELIPDSYTLNSIKLSSAANNIAGDVTIDLSAESRAVVASTGTKQITLTAINQQITTEAKAFYVALPAVSFADKDLTVTFTFADGEKSFALPAFDLLQGSIKTIAYQINDSDDFTGTTPDSGEDFEGETPGEEAYPANNEIWYTNGSTTEATTPYKTDVFGANIVSNTYDATKECWVIKFDGEVTKIGEYAFYSRSSLISITIPNSVTSIATYAFNSCTSMTNINIPNNVTNIGDDAFHACISLTSLTISNSITNIGERAFQFCESLKWVTIPDSVTEIKERAFCECSSLESVTLPYGISIIGEYAFSDCNSLKHITISNSVTHIETGAFSYCTALASITIPNSIISMGAFIFKNCSSLKEVFCKPTLPPCRRHR